jgi:hypothetical protein
MARLDFNQYAITRVSSYKGDPLTRTTCTFKVEFEDGDVVWLPWSTDLSNTVQFEYFCNARPQLFILLFSSLESSKMMAAINRQVISEVSPGDVVYVDLRFWGSDWYHTVGLPDAESHQYVILFRYTHWFHKTTRTKIVATCPVFREEWPCNHYFVKAYGSVKVLPVSATLVDAEFLLLSPQVILTQVT